MTFASPPPPPPRAISTPPSRALLLAFLEGTPRLRAASPTPTPRARPSSTSLLHARRSSTSLLHAGRLDRARDRSCAAPVRRPPLIRCIVVAGGLVRGRDSGSGGGGGGSFEFPRIGANVRKEVATVEPSTAGPGAPPGGLHRSSRGCALAPTAAAAAAAWPRPRPRLLVCACACACAPLQHVMVRLLLLCRVRCAAIAILPVVVAATFLASDDVDMAACAGTSQPGMLASTCYSAGHFDAAAIYIFSNSGPNYVTILLPHVHPGGGERIAWWV